MATPADEGGFEALHVLKAVDPPLWLAPSQDLSRTARTASHHLFSLLKPFCPKSPFDNLLVEGFDAEQIWQQIDLQSQPLLSGLRRQLRRFQKNPEEISKLFGEKSEKLKKQSEALEREGGGLERESERFEGDEGDEDEDMKGFDDDDDEEEEEEEEEEKEEEGGAGTAVGIEDKFLKIKDLEEYLEEDEAREYGLKKKKKGDGKVSNEDEDVDEEDEQGEEQDGGEDEDDDDDDDDELGVFGDGNEENEGADKLENARYEDFFGSKKKKGSKGKLKPNGGSDDLFSDEEPADNKKKESLSTHEKELEKLRSKIEQKEKANLEPKTWTMRGEVTADKRPKNSLLEVDLDFVHNVRPAPVITEEVTASLEDLIRKRIIEGHFDDVQKAPSLPSKAPKEVIELDENKSKKGLAEIYEEEYAQKTGLTFAPLSFSDEQKKEASLLFKKLCLKLDALSHFHFTPKPVIEDMSIQTNVPALAMEEIAPVAVSDAAMLAPEEVFTGKGDIKSEAELTKAERKRRRANKKRKFKTESAKRMAKKARDSTLENRNGGKEEE